MSIEVDMEKDVKGEVSLARKGTIQSITSDLAEKRNDGRNQQEVDEDKYSTLYLFMRIGLLDREGLWRYAVGSVFAISELVSLGHSFAVKSRL